jgi:hypothetical protein
MKLAATTNKSATKKQKKKKLLKKYKTTVQYMCFVCADANVLRPSLGIKHFHPLSTTFSWSTDFILFFI